MGLRHQRSLTMPLRPRRLPMRRLARVLRYPGNKRSKQQEENPIIIRQKIIANTSTDLAISMAEETVC